MMKSNKGFTVVELIASFVFVSILSISLFGIIMNYRDKQIDSSIEADLLAFKSKLTIDIEQDIQRKGLKNIQYCDSSEIDTKKSCIRLNFNDGDTKVFKKYTVKCWKVYCMASESGAPVLEKNECTNGAPPICEGDYKDTSEFSYYNTYLSYGGVRYPIPDADNVTIESDNLLYYTTARDALENNLTLYKINVKLTHVDLDADMDISIVASGTEQVDTNTTPYKAYSIGDIVSVKLNETDTRKFRVVSDSSGYNSSVTLLYDDTSPRLTDIKDSSNVSYVFPESKNKTAFNSDITHGNNYLGSSIEEVINGSEGVAFFWKNADKVRLLTVEELASLANVSPDYRKTFESLDEAQQNLNLNSTAQDWIFGYNYWTSSKVALKAGIENQNGYVWYVDNATGYMKALRVDTDNIYLRPVIEISKDFINN
ncbi:MAG: type II secretion system protein [Bacilli bacterium]|nr:type II secretion system protein [Bacilli bacterium]